jgi:multidrug efflux pump subunit AcrA (membrane-fusion protein)
MRLILVSVLVVSLCVRGASSRADDPAAQCRLSHCLVTLIDEVEVPAQEAGQLLSIDVHEGAAVKAGGLLAQIDDAMVRHQRSVAEAELEAAREKAASDVGVRHARAAAKVAAAEHEQALEANRRQPGTISQAEERRRELSAQTAVLQIEQSELDQRVAALTQRGKTAEVAVADASLARRQIKAPLDGLVVEVAKRPGEWVQPGEMVLRLVRMDRLRVEGYVNGAEFNAEEVDGCPVMIEVPRARGQVERLTGKVTFVNPLAEADGTFTIWAEVDNRKQGRQWLLRPGVTVEMTLDLSRMGSPTVEASAAR